MIKNKNITFDSPVQRPPNQWDIQSKSLLIHSILAMFIPDIYAIQMTKEVEGKNITVYDVIDGLQRLTTISSFLNDEWALTELPIVILESTGEEYDISGKKFSELPEEVQEEIKGYTLVIRAIELEEDDDEETIVEEIFYRLNNGKAVSREHLALVSASRNVQEFVRKTLTENPLFTTVAHYAEGAVKKSDREMTILQSIVLVSGLEYNSFVAKDIEKFFTENTISNEILDKVEGYFVDIAEAFKHEHSKFVNKINISAMVNLLNTNEDTEKVQEFLLWYSKNAKSGDSYKRYCGAGSVKVENVKNRLKGLQDLYNSHVKPVEKPTTENRGTRGTLPKPINCSGNDFDSEFSSGFESNYIPSSVLNAAGGLY